MYVCICNAIKEKDIIETNLSKKKFIKKTGATKNCGQCKQKVNCMFNKKEKKC